MMYEHRNNGKIGELIEKNDKAKTVTLKLADGTFVAPTQSTFKRWWKPLGDEVVEPIIDLDNPITEEEAKKLGRIDGETALEMEDDVAGDGTPLAEVGKEIAKQAKEKAKQAKKQKKSTNKKKEMSPEVTSLLDFISKEAQSAGWEPYEMGQKSGVPIQAKSYKVDGHMFCLVRFTMGSVKIACRSAATQEVATPDRTVNHMFDFIYIFDKATEANKKGIKKLMQASAKYQQAKKQKKDKKKEAK